MHANTFESKKEEKLKTRKYDDILTELRYFRNLMKNHDLPSGISLEATFEDVFECVGGAYPLE